MKRGGGCFLIVFGLPFLCAGLFMMASPFLGGNAPPALFMLPFGFVFVLAGVGVIFLGLREAGIVKTRAGREDPNRPWSKNADWADGRVRTEPGRTALAVWVACFFVNVISMPVLFAAPRELRAGHYGFLVALVFPLIGLGMFIWAVRLTERWRRYGVSVFEMNAVPGAPGAPLRGLVIIGRSLAPPDGFRVTLQSVNAVTTGWGKQRKTTERVAWEDMYVTRPDLLASDPSLTGVAVAFEIPGNARPTDGSDSRNRWFWRLRVLAEVAGVDYDAVFEVPVFRAAPEPFETRVTDEEILAARHDKSFEIRLRPSVVRIGHARRGGTEFYFPPLRGLGAALPATLFFLICVGIAMGVALLAPWVAGAIVGTIFGLLALLTLRALLETLFGTVRVEVARGDVTVERRLFGTGSTASMPAAQVTGVRVAIDGRSGNSPTHSILLYSGATPLKIVFHLTGKP